LTFSRLSIRWVTVGLIGAAYENTVRRLKEQPLNSKNLPVIRAKLSRKLGIFKENFLMTLHQANLNSQGKFSIGLISLVKGEVSRAGRENARLASELLQENGLELDSVAIKVLGDMEVAYTYEGANDINLFVGGRELTGIADIKAPFSLSP
jgi:glutaryl-CoA dehydrogenase